MKEIVLDSWGGVERRDATGVKPDLLQGIRAIAGWGGLVILDHSICVVELIRSMLEVVNKESCGKCTPCRIGTKILLDKVTAIANGSGSSGDIDEVFDLAGMIKDTSLCVWGETSGNAIRDSITYFRDEYEAHVQGKTCALPPHVSLTTAPCQNACPAYCDVPTYIESILERRFVRGHDRIRETIPLPGVLGRVCFHPCESACQRNKYDEPVAICQLKRVVADEALVFPRMDDIESCWKFDARLRREERDKNPKEKIAVIGSGPAGLSVAYYLAMFGYRPTVFEALPVLGGMLRVGIPDFRLPQDVLDQEIQYIADEGVEFRTNVRIGKEISIEDLLKEGYAAIFVSIGAHKGQRLGITGEDEGLTGYINAATFLRRTSMGDLTKPGETVVVIGGGSVAFDAVRAAVRIGCTKSVLVYRRTREDAPAGLIEVEEAEHEGATLHFMAAPVRILSEDGRIKGVEFQKMEMGSPDARGRRTPIPISGSEFVIECDSVIPATGQEPEVEYFSGSGIDVTEKKTIKVNPETFETNISGVFAAGDVVLGPATVVQAIGTGHRAAFHIDKYVRGNQGSPEISRIYEAFKLQDKYNRLVTELTRLEGNSPDSLRGRHREAMVCIPHTERFFGFKEIECGFTRDAYVKEAMRCTRCYRPLIIVEE